jgi:hypothetical protein
MSLPSSTATSISISGLPSGDVECMALCPSGSTPCKPDSTVGRLVCMMEDVNSMALCSLNPSPCNPSQDCLTQSSVRTRMEIDYMQIDKDSMALDTDFSLVQSTDLSGSFLEVISTRSNPLSKQNHSLIVTFFIYSISSIGYPYASGTYRPQIPHIAWSNEQGLRRHILSYFRGASSICQLSQLQTYIHN